MTAPYRYFDSNIITFIAYVQCSPVSVYIDTAHIDYNVAKLEIIDNVHYYYY